MLGFVFEWKRVGFFATSLQALQICPRDDRGKNTACSWRRTPRIVGLTHRPLISFLFRWAICFFPQRIALHISSSPVVPCLDLYLLPWCLFLLTGIVRIISCKVLISLDRFHSKGMSREWWRV